nr:MAG TPA: hypothetical protein [Caudoviricetes sp.]
MFYESYTTLNNFCDIDFLYLDLYLSEFLLYITESNMHMPIHYYAYI